MKIKLSKNSIFSSKCITIHSYSVLEAHIELSTIALDRFSEDDYDLKSVDNFDKSDNKNVDPSDTSNVTLTSNLPHTLLRQGTL